MARLRLPIVLAMVDQLEPVIRPLILGKIYTVQRMVSLTSFIHNTKSNTNVNFYNM